MVGSVALLAERREAEGEEEIIDVQSSISRACCFPVGLGSIINNQMK